MALQPFLRRRSSIVRSFHSFIQPCLQVLIAFLYFDLSRGKMHCFVKTSTSIMFPIANFMSIILAIFQYYNLSFLTKCWFYIENAPPELHCNYFFSLNCREKIKFHLLVNRFIIEITKVNGIRKKEILSCTEFCLFSPQIGSCIFCGHFRS